MLTAYVGKLHLVKALHHGKEFGHLHSAPCHASQFVRTFSEGSGGDSSFIARLWSSVRAKAKNGKKGGGRSGRVERGSDLIPTDIFANQREVFVVPLSRKPLFPGTLMPVQLRDRKLISEIQEMKRDNAQAYVGAFLHKELPAATPSSQPGEAGDAGGVVGPQSQGDIVDLGQLHEVGTFAQVHSIHTGDEKGETAMLLLVGHRRLRRTSMASSSPLRVGVEHLRNLEYDRRADELKATNMEVVSTLKDLLTMHPLYNEQLRSFANVGGDFNNPDRLADMAASLTSADEDALQALLEELDIPKRMTAALVLLKKEVALCKLQVDIGKRVEEKITDDQRRYFLFEQLKSIKKELGLEQDDKSNVVQKFTERLVPLKEFLPEDAEKVIQEELNKLSALEASSSEFNVTRNYLDWLTSLPWNRQSAERLDLAHAEKVLDEDHYGLSDVKERILEFIAVGKLRGNTTGKILCLVGPPGVGKTSVGKSIARALDREYYRFSVGGLSDVAEIKGHRRTYIGAMPGKMVQCLKRTATSNPLVLIDEIDKLGKGWGDPSSAMLELLDPEQNKAFMDHFLDVPIDLSNVLFMCTANVLDSIPGPLLDRMEILRISGYIADEKEHIARQYLEPATRKESGIPEGSSSLTDAALRTLITEYCREAGVRNLKKHLEKIYRKVAIKMVRRGDQAPAPPRDMPATTSSVGEPEVADLDFVTATPTPEEIAARGDDSIVVQESELGEYVGQPPFATDRIYEVTPPGVVMGLAWSSQGGNSLYIEAASVERGDGKGALKTTGQLGEVMKESATIAHTFSRSFLAALPQGSVPADRLPYFAEHAIHVHVPAGATPKDGPSAGCAIITSLLSLALDKPVRPDLAMTGEVTLTGRILPIGGLKEKTLAARRSGITTLIFPGGNRKDWEELSEEVRAGITAHFVEQYKEVFDIALQYDPAEIAKQLPTSELSLQS